MTQTIEFVYRDHNLINDPSSGDYEPEKYRIRALLRQIQNGGGLAVTRISLAALNAVNPPSDYYQGIVLDDPDPANNGYYARVSGAWVWGRGFPDTLSRFTVNGGTENAVTAEIPAGVDPSQVVWFAIIPSQTNTGAVTLNGKPVVNVNGDALAAGEWPAGRSLILTDEGSEFRLWSDPAIDAMLAQAIDLVNDATQLATPGDGTVTNIKVAAGAAIDSTKLAHTNPGTGGVAITLFNKLSTWIDVREFGAVGDGVAEDAPAIQAAMDRQKITGAPIWLPEGRYKISETLLFDRSADPTGSPGLVMMGDGMFHSVFINTIAAGGPSLDLTSGGTAKYQFGGHIDGIGFEEDGSGADSHGIRYRSCWHQRFTNLRFTDLNGAGLKVINSANDADASAHVIIDNIYAVGLQGAAFDSDGGTGGVTLHTINELNAVSCGKTAGQAYIILDGVYQFSMDMSSLSGGAADNIRDLVRIKNTSVRSRQIVFRGGEYGNNSGTHFKIDAVSNLHVDGIRHVRRAAEPNSTIGFDFPDGSSLFSGIHIENCELQIDDATPPWTWISLGTGLDSEGAFFIGAPNRTNLAVGNTMIAYTGSTAKQRAYVIENERGQEVLSAPVKRQRVTTAVAGDITPDLTEGQWYQAVLVGAGAYTVQAPIGGQTDGRRFLLSIFKDGTHTVAWNAAYDPPTVPTNGGTWEFIYDLTSALWRVVQ